MEEDKSRHNSVSQEDSLSVKELFERASWWARCSERRDLLRVATAISLMEAKLQTYEEASATSPGESQQSAEVKESSQGLSSGFTVLGLQMCGRLLKQAKEAFAMGDVDSAYIWANELEREMLVTLSDEELQAKLLSAKEEASEKLTKWRASTVPKLLSASEAAGERRGEVTAQRKETPLSPSRQSRLVTLGTLKEIMLHLHSNSQNLYRNMRQLRFQLTIASLSVTVMVLAMLVLNEMGFFEALGRQMQERLPMAILSGLLGGVLSVAYTVARVDPKQKIPEVKASFLVTVVRPIIGAAVALPVLALIESGLLSLPDSQRLWVVLTFCFLAGFSERWFLGIMEKLEKQKT
jgi:hypothetical protein